MLSSYDYPLVYLLQFQQAGSIIILTVVCWYYPNELVKKGTSNETPKKLKAGRVDSLSSMQADTELSVLIEIRNELLRTGGNWLP